MKNQGKIRNVLKSMGYGKPKVSRRDFVSVSNKKGDANIVVNNYSSAYEPYIHVLTSFHSSPQINEAFAVAKAIAEKTGGIIVKRGRSLYINI